MYVTNVTVLRGERGLTEVTPYDILEAVLEVHDLGTLRFCCPVIIIKFYYFSGRKETRATDRPLQKDRKRNKQPEKKGKAEREEKRTNRDRMTERRTEKRGDVNREKERRHTYTRRERASTRERERERETDRQTERQTE